MDKREQIIEALEMSYTYSNVDENNTLVPQEIVLDIISLLKVQEPVNPNMIMLGNMFMYYQCPSCVATIDPSDNFCRRCGRAVKWK